MTIGELSGLGVLTFSDGYRTKRSELSASGFRIIRVADIADGVVSLSGNDFVSRDRAQNIGAKAGCEGDVLLTTKGTVGRVAVLGSMDQEVVYSPQLCFFRVHENDTLDRDYLRYWFSSDDFRNQASYRKGNTDMADYINLADISSLSIPLPTIDAQRRTADLLRAFDEKIVGNRRLVRTCQDLAQSIFEEYAITEAAQDFRFDEVAQIDGGGTPTTSIPEYWSGGVPWATPTDVTALQAPYLRSTARTITDLGLANCSSKLYPVGSILMTSRATIGSFALTEVPTAVNQGFIVVNAMKTEHKFWIFHDMLKRVPEFISHSNGATFLELSRGRFKAINIKLPDDSIIGQFNERAASIHKMGAQADREAAALIRARDALLPLVLSGRIQATAANTCPTKYSNTNNDED